MGSRRGKSDNRRQTPRNRQGVNEQTAFLIVCEGKKTETYYFKAFPQSARLAITVIHSGTKTNPSNVVNRAIKLKTRDDYDVVWCVFDYDNDSRKEDFTRAINHAKQHDIHVAYSNPTFELWYVLHFAYRDTAASSDALARQLTDNLGHTYEKNDPYMYTKLAEKQPTAIEYATRLHQSYSPHDPATDNPCTTVHLLVGTLNANARA